MTPIRLTVVLTHPVQYMSPWFRHIATHHPELSLTVLYATRPTAEQQAVGFGRAFEWDVPLTEGYRSLVVRPPRAGDSVHSSHFFGLDVPELVDELLATDPEVVLISGWYSVTLVRALWACRRRGIPVLYRGDTNLEGAPTGWRAAVWGARTATLLHMFSGYLSVGARARAYLDRFFVLPQRIFDSPHFVDDKYFAKSAGAFQATEARNRIRAQWSLGPNKFVVLFVGKLDANKRVADAVAAVHALGPGARLAIAGSGAEEASLRVLEARLGCKISWLGFLNQSELGAAYAVADCLVLPSEHETWGLAANEAMAAGLPCVLSDHVGCAPDLVPDESTGEQFPRGDVDALRAALARVRSRIASGHSYRDACRARAAKFSMETATTGLLTACRALVRRRPEPNAELRVVACCGAMSGFTGLERMTFEVLRVIREHGGQVHCIVNTWKNERIVDATEAIGGSWSTGFYWYPFRRHSRDPKVWARALYDVAMTSSGLYRDARSLRATHVFVPEFLIAIRNAPALALLRLRGVRIVLRLGNAPVTGAMYRRLWQTVGNPVLDLVVSNSKFTDAALQSQGFPRTKSRVIYNTVPSRAVETEPGTVERDWNRVVYVGQLIPEKGVDLLISAVADLVGRGLDVKLDIVGDTNGWVAPKYKGFREHMFELANQPVLRDRVRFLGWREDVPAVLATAGVHCCPSRPEQEEGFGLVNVEAKGAGIPSVVAPTGALPELIEHGVDGWICSAPTAEALAEGLYYFLSDHDRQARAGIAARNSLGRFSRERFSDAWWSVFSSVQAAGSSEENATRE